MNWKSLFNVIFKTAPRCQTARRGFCRGQERFRMGQTRLTG